MARGGARPSGAQASALFTFFCFLEPGEGPAWGGWVECSEGIWDLMKTPTFAPRKLKSYCGVSTRQSLYFPGSWAGLGVGAKRPCCLLCPVSSGQNGQTPALELSAGGGVAGLWAHCGCSKAGVPGDQSRTLRLPTSPPNAVDAHPNLQASPSGPLEKAQLRWEFKTQKTSHQLRVLHCPMLL